MGCTVTNVSHLIRLALGEKINKYTRTITELLTVQGAKIVR